MDLEYATPTPRRPWNVRRMIRRALLPAFVSLAFALYAWFPGAFHRHTDEVDIRSGRVRRSDYVFSIQTHQAAEESLFSQVVPPATGVAAVPDWHSVNTFTGGGRVSPHHSYHGAIAQIEGMDQVWQLVPFTPEAKRSVVRAVLDEWQGSGSYFGAAAYIRSVEAAAWQIERTPGRSVTVGDLPAAVGAAPPSTGTTRPAIGP